MFTEIKNSVWNDRKLRLILAGGFIIQLITCLTAIGFYHPDQHFQILEFSSAQLGNESGSGSIWEYHHFIRPTFQVYLFSAYYKICVALTITDPFLQLTILRVFTGLTLFALFNLISIHFFKKEKRNVFYSVMLMVNFSWILPYTRTLFNSEMLSSLLFFGTLYLFIIKKDTRPGAGFLILTGFLLGLTFYTRFQMGFALTGFGLWLLFVEKKYTFITPLVAGFLLAILINTYLDYRFYGTWVCTPYEYFYSNITEGRAATFGTSSFLRYIGLLVAVITAPPFSLVLLYFGCKAMVKKNVLVISVPVFLFILFHSLIGHKEERFLFPVLNILPVIIGWGLPGLFNYYDHCRRWIRYILKTALLLTIILNTTVLILFGIIPYSQPVHFASVLHKKFTREPTTVYCLYRTPLETPSGYPLIFYSKSMGNPELKKILQFDSIQALSGKNILLATTFNDIKLKEKTIDSLGFTPVLYSSSVLWNINLFLNSKKINTINDIWVLYIKK